MKKLKSIWQNNKIIIVLFIILIACFIAIVTVALSYFVGTDNNPYGNRLDNKVAIPKEMEESIKTSLKGSSSVVDSSYRLAVRTIYIDIKFTADTTLEDAKTLAESTINIFSEEVLNYYDVNLIISNESEKDADKYTLMGARNSKGSGIIWNNNTPIKEEEETKNEK